MRGRALVLAGFFGLASVVGAFGYAFIGTVWNTREIVMHLQLGNSGGTLIDGSSSWNASAEEALAIWNKYIRNTKFFVVRNSAAPIQHGDDVNSVYFDSSVYGTSFDGAVAITTEWRRRGIRTEADVIFNTEYSWNSYRGRLRNASGGGTLYDLRRVAIHEFGHVLGLDHPDQRGQGVVAIMNSRVSNIDTVQADDIAGAQELYGVRVGPRPLGAITKPGQRKLSTGRPRLMFRGTGNPARVNALYLSSHRIPGRYFRTTGVERWRRVMRLKRGVNRMTLYADTGAPKLKEVSRVVVTRR